MSAVFPFLTDNLNKLASHTQQQNDAISLLDHSLVTTDFDALKFSAAASQQLAPTSTSYPDSKPSPYLISSPYNSPAHLLDLRRLDTPNRLLAKALTALKPIRPDYATASYESSFNWEEVFSTLAQLASTEQYAWQEQIFYVVIFRSRLKPTIDLSRLMELDSKSHEEATISGGLLKYWFGNVDDENQNLATCHWRSKEDARLGGLGPWHLKARHAARELYANITFTIQKLVISDGIQNWRFESWEDNNKL
ncbi:MAG: hypothetical protein M1834_009343 [Cirrosporium novae-zelandiae]|nr:MAG: hypothetical protein M1834_009343 [Cirrosporium novae-zelandiae]